MRVVVFAYHDIGCSGIRALLSAGFDIQAVFTHQDAPTEHRFFESVAQLCANQGLPVYAPDDPNTAIWVERIRDLAPHYLFSFYYRRLLLPKLLTLPFYGAYNLHGSLLPAYRGRAPVNWVLVNGETETGVTLHRMTQKPDAGDIVARRRVSIERRETAGSLHVKLNSAAQALLAECLPSFHACTIAHTPQSESKASYFGRRRPEDGELNWREAATTLDRLVRAVTSPYPGAFTFAGERKLTVWQAEVLEKDEGAPDAGTVMSINPLRIACGQDALEIRTGQGESGIPLSGRQLAQEMGLVPGMVLGPRSSTLITYRHPTKVLILGVNGFIGNHLTERLLRDGNYAVYGMDVEAGTIERFLEHPRFHFLEGDIGIHREWLEYHIKKCDVILPLVAIATPMEYVRNPLRVFELDFEENLRIVRYCVKYRKRIVFPSTSEVYGMCEDPLFDEETSRLVVGPINKQRWIYSASKQLLDRVIWAYGETSALQFTLFRPFNWMGPRLDSLDSARIGSSRAITQLILNLVEGTPIKLVDGGHQRRCFTDIDDGIEALFGIIENRGGGCDSQIINIGHPDNEASIRDLADMLLEKFEDHPLRASFPPFAGMQSVESRAYYGGGYEDVAHRRPSIENARRLLGWNPSVRIEDTIEKTLDFFLAGAVEDRVRT